MRLNEREDILELTREWKGERFPDGRPRVSDEKLAIIKTLTQEEIWHPLYFSGYRFQFQGNLRTLHQGKKLYGRAVTCCFAPQRPDLRRLSFDTAAAKGWKGDCNQWVIDSLVEGDVVVCDLYDKIFKGTFVGGNLTTAVKARTKTGGAVVWGGVRDIEQMRNGIGNKSSDFLDNVSPVDCNLIQDDTVDSPFRHGHIDESFQCIEIKWHTADKHFYTFCQLRDDKENQGCQN